MRQSETSSVVKQELFDNSRLMTKREVADFFRVSTRTIDRWILAGKLKKIKVGGDSRFESQEIARLTGKGENLNAKSVS